MTSLGRERVVLLHFDVCIEWNRVRMGNRVSTFSHILV